MTQLCSQKSTISPIVWAKAYNTLYHVAAGTFVEGKQFPLIKIFIDIEALLDIIRYLLPEKKFIIGLSNFDMFLIESYQQSSLVADEMAKVMASDGASDIARLMTFFFIGEEITNCF